jgi:DNA primase
VPHPAAQAVPILTVAAALGLEISGRKARCFNGAAHRSGADETPALVFLPKVNGFKCYACGVHGDAISLVQVIRGVSFPEAVQYLFDLARTTPGSAVVPGRASSTASARTPDDPAQRVYARLHGLSYELSPRSPGGKYLRGRGLDVDLAHRHHVTELRDPDGVWEELTTRYSEDRIRAAGLMSRSGGFLFARHRLLCFFMRDGWPRFVQARDITGEASCKELSVAGLRSPVPYNVDVLKQGPDRVLVCEGGLDTLSAVQLGYAAVGVPGVMGFRDEWFPLFRDVRHVTIVFDNDDAGRRQATELRSQFRLRGIRADAQFPSRVKDVNDLMKSLSRGENQ